MNERELEDITLVKKGLLVDIKNSISLPWIYHLTVFVPGVEKVATRQEENACFFIKYKKRYEGRNGSQSSRVKIDIAN